MFKAAIFSFAFSEKFQGDRESNPGPLVVKRECCRLCSSFLSVDLNTEISIPVRKASQAFIVSQVFIRFDLPGLGDVCLAQSPADDLWHRVVYLGHPDVESDGDDGDGRAHGLAIVHFVDFGFYVSKLLL